MGRVFRKGISKNGASKMRRGEEIDREKKLNVHGSTRGFRIIIVVTLVVYSVQGWFGDFVNIFVAPTNGTTAPPYTMSGFFQSMQSLGFGLVWHAYEGLALVGLSAAIFALSFKWSKSKGVRIASGLGLLSVISAALGGFLFVMSGFSNGGNSAQMGGSFIAAYALFFVTLYYAK
jgi:hypothetical protein